MATVERPIGGSSHGVVPLVVGANVYAVERDRIATVLRLGGLDDVSANDTLELGPHSVPVFAAGAVLGERTTDDESTVVVFYGRDGDGCVAGWLVDDVHEPVTVSGVEVTAGAVRHVRGYVDVDGRDVVVVDPARIHGT